MDAAKPSGRPRGFDREAALVRAMRLFWERGYDGASIADLTAAMGINPPSLYAAFGSKDALFEEAVRLYGETEGGATEYALEQPPTARAAIEAMLRGNAEVYVDPDKPAGCMVVLSATVRTPRNAAARDLLADLRRKSEERIAERIRRGVADGDVPASTDVERLATFCMTVLEGLSVQARDGASRATMQAIVATAMGAWDAATS